MPTAYSGTGGRVHQGTCRTPGGERRVGGRWRPGLVLALLLAGCASPSQKITRALVAYGVPAPQAQCMGDKLGRRLSVAQLLRIQELTGIDGRKLEGMTIRQIADRLTDRRDPELVAEFVRAGIACAF